MKFEVGSIYTRPGLFGPSWYVTCMARTENTATFAQTGYEQDLEDWATIEIMIDTSGTEICECYEYMKHKGYIRADR